MGTITISVNNEEMVGEKVNPVELNRIAKCSFRMEYLGEKIDEYTSNTYMVFKSHDDYYFLNFRRFVK